MQDLSINRTGSTQEICAICADHADCTSPTRHYELNHADQDYISALRGLDHEVGTGDLSHV